MNKIALLLIMLVSLQAAGQEDLSRLTEPIVAEGKRLYRSEMASWHGTDLFLEAYKERSNIGGYFSYTEGQTAKCIFFSRSDNPQVIGTVSFDSTYNTQTAHVDLTARVFSSLEHDLYTIRRLALEAINSDTLFQSYQNTTLNLIPLIANGEKKVYMLTGTGQHGVVLLGNDYLITFNADNKIITKKALHKNLIPIYYGDKEQEGKEIVGTMHTHLPETGDFITATDICTLMLYQHLTKWNQHNVVSENYLNVWNGITNELAVTPMSAIEKIEKDQEQRNGKKKEK